jgi:kynurenine formamidase
VGAVGIDTASIDFGKSVAFETHRALFEAEIPALEKRGSGA